MLCNIGNRRLKCFGCTEFLINLCLFQAYEIIMRWRSCKWILYFLRNNLYCLLKFIKSKHISVKFAALTKISTVWKTKKPKFRSLDFKYDFMYRCKKKKITFCKNFEREFFFSTFTIYNICELLMLCNLLNLSISGPFHFPSNNFQITKKKLSLDGRSGQNAYRTKWKKEDNHFSSISFTHVYQYMNMILFEWG